MAHPLKNHSRKSVKRHFVPKIFLACGALKGASPRGKSRISYPGRHHHTRRPGRSVKRNPGIYDKYSIPEYTSDTRKYAQIRTNTHKFKYAPDARIRTIRTNTREYAASTRRVRTNTRMDTHEYARVRTAYANGYARIRTDTHGYTPVPQGTHASICVCISSPASDDKPTLTHFKAEIKRIWHRSTRTLLTRTSPRTPPARRDHTIDR